jgi:phage tail sheath protein FI
MLPVFKYPGVYIEELPSAVHRVADVATSIAAFVGCTPQGPVNQATLVLSWQDFQTQFGEWGHLGNAVKGFFADGGQQVYIVRIITTSPLGEADLAAVLKIAIQNIPVRWRHH